MSRGVRYRPARLDDLPACTRIWSIGIEDYVRRLNQPWFGGDLEPLRRLLAHFLATDPTRFWVATAPGEADTDADADEAAVGATDHRVVGFASATLRGRVWFLGMLFVLPELQSVGIGTTLFERVMPDGPATTDPMIAMGTATDSVQPISNALYGRYGLVPRLPVFNFVGRPERPEALGGLPEGLRVIETVWADPSATGEQRAVDAVDGATLGFAHPEDHAFLRSEGRRRFVVWSEGGGAVGYGYVAPSGRFGPIAAVDASLLAPIAGHLLATVRAPGAYATWIPGAADDLFAALLRAGFRFESFPTLLLWNRPIADFSRYVPINLALL